MAYKRIERTIEGKVCEISRRGTHGIELTISHASQGSKHYTHYVEHFQLGFCDMRRMGQQFHVIMDQLSKEWHSTKKAISGESSD